MSIEKQNWLHLSSVQIGGAICMPMILIGYELAKKSPQDALLAIVVGNLFLFLLAICSCQMSVESQATTVENAARYFGSKGKAFFGLIMTLSMCAWFAIQSQVMSQDLTEAARYVLGAGVIDTPFLTAAISAGIVFATLKGIRNVAMLANIAVPLMIMTLGLAIFMAYQNRGEIAPVQPFGSLAQGISLVIAAAILAVIDLPTFFRHAKTKEDAVKAAVATFLIGMPLVELVGVLLGAWTQAPQLVDALSCFPHPLWKGWIWLFILLAGWTTNNANLYSGAMSLHSLIPKINAREAILLTGAISIVLSAFDILSRLALVLDLMGVSVASMGAVILTAYFLKQRYDKPLNETAQGIAWLIGALMGFANLFCNFSITPIAILDAATVSAVSLLVLKQLEMKREKILAD